MRTTTNARPLGLVVTVLSLAMTVGCAAAPAPAIAVPGSALCSTSPTAPTPPNIPRVASPAADLGWAAAPSVAEGLAPPLLSRRLSPLAGGTVRLAVPSAAPTRPPRTHHANVHFSRAEMENALQFLADTGRFNLVLESGMSGQVSAILDDVDPYDALVALAEAHGASVKYENGIAMVRKR